MTMVNLILSSLMVALVVCQEYGPVNPTSAGPYPVSSGAAQQSPLMPYSFEYAVNDDDSGLDFGHKESSDGTAVTGTYYVLLPDGRVETVVYKADANGYVADVSFEGEASGSAQPQQPAQQTSGQLQSGYGEQAALPPTTAYPTAVPTTSTLQSGYFVPAAPQPLPTTIPVQVATTPLPVTTTIPVATTVRVATTQAQVTVPAAAPQPRPTTVPVQLTTTIPVATTTPVLASTPVPTSIPVAAPATAVPATAVPAATWPAVKAPVVPVAPIVNPTPSVIPANSATLQTTQNPAGFSRATAQVVTQDVNYSSYGQSGLPTVPATPAVPAAPVVPTTSAPLISALGQKTTTRPGLSGY